MFDDDFQLPGAQRNKYILDVTNLIDLLIILIIFFVATTTFSRLGVQINQPKAKAVVKVPSISVQIDIDSQGTTYFERKAISLADLQALISTKLSLNPQIVVLLNIDRNTSTQHLLNAMDACKSGGAERFSFAAHLK